MPEPITLQQAAKDALMCQNACNLSGVAHSFLQAVQAVNEGARRIDEGTDWRNNHPIIRLYVDKLASLCGMQGPNSIMNYAQADWDCQRIAEQSACATCGRAVEKSAVSSGDVSVCDACADEATREEVARA